MNIEKKLDKIIDILYDENLLHWKAIPVTDIMVFGLKKYNIDWTDNEISFIMTMLINDGYVILNKGDFSEDNMQMPTYSLTTKGIQLKHKGGFTRTKLVENVKQKIILWGSIIALIVSFITIYDFIDKHLSTKKEKNRCCNCSSSNILSCKVKKTTTDVDTLQTITDLDSLPINKKAIYITPAGTKKIINHTPPPEEEDDESSSIISAKNNYMLASVFNNATSKPKNKNCDAIGCPSHCNFDGKKRKDAKTSISQGVSKTYATVSDFLSMFADKHPDANMPAIIGKTSKRVPLEDFNITITKAWLFCFAKETDEDYHLVIGTKKEINDPNNRFMIVEISGLPESGSSRTNLSKVQDDFFKIVGKPICTSGYYWFDNGNDPEPITISGSLYWDIEHWSTKNKSIGNHGPSELKDRLTTVWEIHPITNIKKIQ